MAGKVLLVMAGAPADEGFDTGCNCWKPRIHEQVTPFPDRARTFDHEQVGFGE